MAKLLILSLPNLSRCDSSSSRSTIRDLKGRFVVLLHAIIHGKIVKKKFFLVSSLSKSSPPSSLDSSKILSHVSRYFIYIYIETLLYSPRFLASPSRISQSRQLLIDLSHRIHGAFSSRYNRGTDVAIDVDNR